MPQHPQDNIPRLQADEELGTIRVTRKRRADVAPPEAPSTPRNKRAPLKKKAKLEEKAPAQDLNQIDLAAALKQINSRIENLTNIVERGIKIYASTMGISPQAFTDDAVFDREIHRLLDRQQSILREEKSNRAQEELDESEVLGLFGSPFEAFEKRSGENSNPSDEESEASDEDQLLSPPRIH